MISYAVDLLLTAVFLKFIADALPDIEIDGFGPALIMAVAMSAVGVVFGLTVLPLIGPQLSSLGGLGGWVGAYGISFMLSVIVFLVAAAIVPGIQVRSATAGVVAALLLAVLRTAAAIGIRLAADGLVKT